MLSLMMIGTLAAGLAAGEANVLESRWLLNGVGRAVVVEVEPPGYGQILDLVLMDWEGTKLAGPVEAAPGEVRLDERMPEVWALRETGYLQMYADGDAAGSALVIEPLLSRLVPVVEEAEAPSGIRYAKVVGWHDERQSPEGEGEGVEAEAEGRLFGGLRIYVERDVVLRTSLGDLRIALRADEAPNTAWNFLRLCEGGFYRGVAFHRIVPMTRDGDPFVIQSGDPTGTGNGGPGYWLPLERSGLAHDFGVVSMARDMDPDSAGSQFFICLSRSGTARLDGHYCAFGEVVEGGETILRIAEVELADVAAGRPMEPPVIEGVEVVGAPGRQRGVGRPDARVKRYVAPEGGEEEATGNGGRVAR